MTPADKPGLYSAALADPRERDAQPRQRTRGRTSARAEPTSDVTRFRGIVAAAAAGAVASLVAALAFPSAG